MILIASDLHLTSRQKDRYRFDLFRWLNEKREKHQASLVIILGDITDEKDKHDSFLVNQVVDGLTELASHCPVVILMGNHDYLADPDNPFFKFLSHMKNIKFVSKPATWLTSTEKKLFFIPHIRDHETWDSIRLDKRPDYAFIHQCLTGAISETGRRLDGYSLKPLKRLKCPVYAGDVHHPHKVGPAEYIGPPYHVRFGDNFNPRCLLLDEETGKTKNLRFKCPRKWTLRVRDADEIKDLDYLEPGDQVKVELELTREEVPEWPVHKDRIVSMLRELRVESFGITLKAKKAKKRVREADDVKRYTKRTVTEVLGGYCKSEKLPRTIREAGKRILEDG